jgi:hypothetical protein
VETERGVDWSLAVDSSIFFWRGNEDPGLSELPEAGVQSVLLATIALLWSEAVALDAITAALLNPGVTAALDGGLATVVVSTLSESMVAAGCLLRALPAACGAATLARAASWNDGSSASSSGVTVTLTGAGGDEDSLGASWTAATLRMAAAGGAAAITRLGLLGGDAGKVKAAGGAALPSLCGASGGGGATVGLSGAALFAGEGLDGTWAL